MLNLKKNVSTKFTCEKIAVYPSKKMLNSACRQQMAAHVELKSAI